MKKYYIIVFIISIVFVTSCSKKIPTTKNIVPNAFAQFYSKTEEMLISVDSIIENLKQNMLSQEKYNMQGASPEISSEINKKYETIVKDTVELHKIWNDMSITLMDKFVSKNYIKEFGDNLNALTIAVNKKDILNIEFLTNEFYKYYPIFISKFDIKYSPENFRMLYFSRGIIYYSQVENFEQAIINVNKLRESLYVIKEPNNPKLNEIIKITDNSITEVEKAIYTKDHNIIHIKIELLNQNIRAIIDTQKMSL